MDSFGENVRKYRRKKDMTQAELAEKLGYKNKASIGKIENGNNEVLISMAEKIAEALGVDVMQLLHGDPEDEYSEYLPYIKNMAERDPEKLRVIREMLGMPPRTESTGNISAIHAKMA